MKKIIRGKKAVFSNLDPEAWETLMGTLQGKVKVIITKFNFLLYMLYWYFTYINKDSQIPLNDYCKDHLYLENLQRDIEQKL